MLAYLILPDGGKVEFKATSAIACDYELIPPCTSSYSYQAQAIIDPYGLRTTLTYNTDGSLNTIREPGGRWIQIIYRTGSTEIDHLWTSDNQRVQYDYSQASHSPGTAVYTQLDSVNYPYDSTLGIYPTASYTYQAPNVSSYYNGYPLLASCDDPMYAGPIKKISYTYATGINSDNSTVVVGQIQSENSGTTGLAMSTLGFVVSGRAETRPDGNNRQFLYGSGRIGSWSDYYLHFANQQYDSNTGFISSTTDRNGHTRTVVSDSISGNVKQVTFPATPNDTPSGTLPGQITRTYGSASCPDPNNRDGNNPYYLCSITDEAGNVTRFTRDANKRIAQIDYPDGGSETFAYDSLGHVLSHVMKTGGTGTFTYDPDTHLMKTYRDPDHATGNPTARYQYDAWSRVSGVTDALGSGDGDPNHTISYSYNARGQLRVTTLPTDPYDHTQHTIVNTYNSNGDGTLISVSDPLGQTTSYTYDNYRRVRSVTTPQRFSGDTTPRTAYLSYDLNQGTGDDYTHADANVRRLTLPSGKLIESSYDANYRKQSATNSAADGATDSSTTSFEYDYAGNLTKVKNPDPQSGQASSARSTNYNYDERNRVFSIVDALNHPTNLTYDAAGRKKSVQRANGQTVTIDSYDPMNRVLQQTSTQDPTPAAVTKFSYYPSGLLHTMQDPHLVALNNGEQYSYEYDLLGRKKHVTYPRDANGAQTSETFDYDTAGHLYHYTNRVGNVQTLYYDNLNRSYGFDWGDGYTPQQRITYDAASRVTQIWNWDATIDFTYYNDGSLHTQSEITPDYGDNILRMVTYGYDADGNRASIAYPMGYSFNYDYTGRNEVKDITFPAIGWTLVSYLYDLAGNRKDRTMHQGTVTTYTPDVLNRTSSVQRTFTGGQTARFDYGYDVVNQRTYEQRIDPTGALADGFAYDLAGQVTVCNRNGWLNPGDGLVYGAANPGSLQYDANGNRTSVTENGGTRSYTVDNLNEYTSESTTGAITSNSKGDIQTYNGWTYTYDAQNRLRDAVKGSDHLSFWYDGLNRQITRNVNGTITFNVWDGWDLIEEHGPGNSAQEYYVHGAATDELVLHYGGAWGTNWYAYDGRGNVSNLFGDSNELLERYTYDLHGTPTVFDPSGNVRTNGTAWDTRFLFQGRQYYKEATIYDYRNRFYNPGLGRFLQADPLGFAAGDSNLFRYCGGDPINWVDPSGLDQHTITVGGGLGVMITWGTNNGQTNFGYYLGVGLGLSYSYTPSTSEYVFPGVVPGIAGQYTEGIGKYASVNVNVLNSTQGGAATATTGVGYKNHQLQFGVTIDPSKSPPYSSAPPTYGYMDGMFAGIGATSYGTPAVPVPGGTTFVDPSDCQAPECVTTERVTVTSTYRPSTTYLSTGVTYFNGSGSPFHLGTTGNILNGPAFTVGNWFPGLTSAGGGDWLTVMPGGNFGGQPGEGFHPVGLELE